MNGKCEEEVLINRARRNWRLIRKKLKIVVMIGNLGLNTFNELRESKNSQQKEKEDIPEAEAPFSSRLIIPQDSTAFMVWSGLVTIMFVVYVTVWPIFVSYHTSFAPS